MIDGIIVAGKYESIWFKSIAMPFFSLGRQCCVGVYLEISSKATYKSRTCYNLIMEETKTSNIKTKHDISEVEKFVITKLEGVGSISKLVEGHTSQAFSFMRKDGKKYVLRIAANQQGFLRDRYAHVHFASKLLPIPKIIEIGDFKENSHYCLSEFVEGKPSDQLSQEEMNFSLENQLLTFAEIFKAPVNDEIGWGEIDVETGKAPFETWHEYIWAGVDDLDGSLLKAGLLELGLDESLYDRFFNQFESCMGKLPSPEKRLVHGDLGFDNVLVNQGKVAAIIDWADIGYGDWVFDIARCDFWHPNKYGSIKDFGRKYNLDCEFLDERIKVCTSFVALTTLDYALQYESESTKSWLSKHLSSRL
ncbi:aminoglycoside phosphotransferase family protein [Candidatus Dojkabacteria bacterium]|uniref:Aminoglycoside phosphotransferase family protein n=1 Tax=Candidatus Dojkabacteria bacterium TaxID=2099670 RepID=A0A955L4M3_9BACT|nr:aminoglycoside phosphotransferase family protein [Candidatus Dojkabacteria bacterium]